MTGASRTRHACCPSLVICGGGYASSHIRHRDPQHDSLRGDEGLVISSYGRGSERGYQPRQGARAGERTTREANVAARAASAGVMGPSSPSIRRGPARLAAWEDRACEAWLGGVRGVIGAGPRLIGDRVLDRKPFTPPWG